METKYFKCKCGAETTTSNEAVLKKGLCAKCRKGGKQNDIPVRK